VYNNFVSFSGSAGNPVMPPDIRLDLSFIYLGTSGQAECGLAESAGQTCTPIIPSLVGPNNPTGLSSYDFTNTATGSTLSISLSGTATRISTNETTQFIGLLQVTFVGMSFQDVMSQLSANNYTGTVMTPYSATFTALVGPGQQGEVPEPTFLIPLGGALVGIAGIQRRRRAKTA
jgi:hypothetical protein